MTSIKNKVKGMNELIILPIETPFSEINKGNWEWKFSAYNQFYRPTQEVRSTSQLLRSTKTKKKYDLFFLGLFEWVEDF